METDPDDYTVIDGVVVNVKNGTYYRDENDFDHGRYYKTPEMKYTRVRRSSTEVWHARASAISCLVFVAWLIGVPFWFWYADSGLWWMVVGGMFSLLGILLAVLFFVPLLSRFDPDVSVSPSLFQFSWNGDLPVLKAQI